MTLDDLCEAWSLDGNGSRAVNTQLIESAKSLLESFAPEGYDAAASEDGLALGADFKLGPEGAKLAITLEESYTECVVLNASVDQLRQIATIMGAQPAIAREDRPTCPTCEAGRLFPGIRSMTIKYKGDAVSAQDIPGNWCDTCEEAVFDTCEEAVFDGPALQRIEAALLEAHIFSGEPDPPLK